MNWLIVDDGDERYQIPVENISYIKIIKRSGYTSVTLKSGALLMGRIVSQADLDKEDKS